MVFVLSFLSDQFCCCLFLIQDVFYSRAAVTRSIASFCQLYSKTNFISRYLSESFNEFRAQGQSLFLLTKFVCIIVFLITVCLKNNILIILPYIYVLFIIKQLFSASKTLPNSIWDFLNSVANQKRQKLIMSKILKPHDLKNLYV